MKQLVVVSGKGGTGKTSVSAGIAHLASQTHRVVLADADVDAANMALVLSPTHIETQNFTGGKIAVIDVNCCTSCGICATVCRFEAIQSEPVYQVDPVACEGCAACAYQCPANAINMEPQQAGTWSLAKTPYGLLYHAHLFAGQENSGKLVTLVKSMARLRALDDGVDYLLVDGPPGIGCPVIATLAGADLVLIVAEPSIAGVHDMERTIELAAHFRIPTMALINKADLNPTLTEAITNSCIAQGIPVAGNLPYDASVTENMVRGLPMTMSNSPVTSALQKAWALVQSHLAKL
jgi:MinD superfamily P-loop ATPase